MMVDERYQKLLAKASREWEEVPKILDAVFKAVQNFLYPGPVEGAADASADLYSEELGSVEHFTYAEAEAEAESETESESSGMEANCVLVALYEKAADGSEHAIDLAALFAGFKEKASELKVPESSTFADESSFEGLLQELLDKELIDGDENGYSLSDKGMKQARQALQPKGS